MNGDCELGSARRGTCIRGTPFCGVDHAEPTLLDRLDQAEADLVAAQRALDRACEAWPLLPGVFERGVMTVNAASARCMAAAARCLVTVEST